jgi:hypothetical protein
VLARLNVTQHLIFFIVWVIIVLVVLVSDHALEYGGNGCGRDSQI